MEVWESVILLLGYALYIAFMTKNEKVADWIERRRLGGKRVTPGEMTRSVSQGPDFKAAIVRDMPMNLVRLGLGLTLTLTLTLTR